MVLIDKRYELLEVLGSGGMGTVFRAYDRLAREYVALKRVNRTSALLPHDSDTTPYRSQLALAHEFRLLASLRHPHIVGVRDYGFEQGDPFYTMDWLPQARPLTDFRDAPLATKTRFITEILTALSYLHRQNVIHRDLKPANVLVVEERVRVVDFGLAISHKGQLTNEFAGTLAYLAPEAITRHATSFASDVYAVGVIAYELFAEYPFPHQNMTELIDAILNLPIKTADLDLAQPMAQWVVTMMQKEPHARPQTAQEALKLWHNALGEKTRSHADTLIQQTAVMVGRDHELSRLQDSLQQAKNGIGTLWLAGGESGVGKSRLIEELRTLALTEGMLVLRGQSSQGAGLLYDIWWEPLRRLVLANEPSGLDASSLKEVVTDLETLLERTIPDAPPLETFASRQRLYTSVVRLFRGNTQPTLLLLEDLHWEDDESIELLIRLMRATNELPLLIVGTFRNDEMPTLPERLPYAHVLTLSRLSREHIAQLSHLMLGVHGAETPLVDMLAQTTQGNAFFIVEVVRTLSEELGGAEQVGVMTLPPSVLTGGILRVLQRRIERVPQVAQAWLKRCAVVGRELDFRLVEENEGWLLACAEIGVLEVHENVWRFTHDKLREYLLSQLDETEKRQLHQAVAEQIERIYPNDTARASLLAEHWQLAGVHEKEAYYWLLSAPQLIAIGNFERAKAQLNRALIYLVDSLSKATAHLLIGRVYLRLSDYPTASAHYEQALIVYDLLNDAQGRANALLGLSDVAKWADNFSTFNTYQEQALAVCEAIGDKRGLAQGIANLGVIARAKGDYMAETDNQLKALALYRELGDTAGVAYCLDNLGVSARLQGRLDDARTYQAQARQVCEDDGDRWGVARALNGLGYIERLLGNYSASEAYYQESVALFRVTGDKWGIASGLNGLGYVYWLQERYPESVTFFEESIRLCLEIDDKWGVSVCYVGLGHVRTSEGNYLLADTHYRQALAIAQSIPVNQVILEAMVGLSNLAYERGNADIAFRCVCVALNHEACTHEARQLAESLLQEWGRAFVAQNTPLSEALASVLSLPT